MRPASLTWPGPDSSLTHHAAGHGHQQRLGRARFFGIASASSSGALKQAAPLRQLPDGITDLDQFRVQRRDRAGGVIHEYHLVA